jgi:hypothetical protein
VPGDAHKLRPCQVTEYPHPYDAEALGFDAGDHWPNLMDGSKIGGWIPWYQTGPETFPCPDCGTDSVLLLSLHTHERRGGCSCEVDETGIGWECGREGALNILVRHQTQHHAGQPAVVHGLTSAPGHAELRASWPGTTRS